MNKTSVTKPASRFSSKNGLSKRLKPDELIKGALNQARVAIESAQSATNHLNALILTHRVRLVPEATIVRESANLLQHVEQNFRRLALTHLKEDPCE